MKCKCGNEMGRPLVKPNPIVIHTTKGDFEILFMAGFVKYESGQEEC